MGSSEHRIMPSGLIDRLDIVRGVGELIVDEAKAALHGLFDHIHHEPLVTESEHFQPDA